MSEVAGIIIEKLLIAIKSKYGFNACIAQKHILLDKLLKLNPCMPVDGTPNYIAFAVPGEAHRKKLKTNRFLVRKLGLKEKKILPDSNIQALTHEINQELYPGREKTVRIDFGLNITKNYANSVGGTSCMTDYSSKYVGMYANNPDIYSQLVMISENDTSRAILIKLDNGKLLMDRVYSTCQNLSDDMYDYAQKHGYLYREYASAGNTGICSPDGTKYGNYKNIIVSNVKIIEGEIPFADTLTQYKYNSNGIIDIFHQNAGYSADGSLDDTSGCLSSDLICDNCADGVSDEDNYSIDGSVYCEACYEELFTYCESCNKTVSNDEIVEVHDRDNNSTYVCESCRNRNYTYCRACGEYYHNGDVREHDDSYYCESCFSDLFLECECCNEFHSNDIITDFDNIGAICDDCYEEKYYTCEACDEVFSNDSKVEHESKEYCPDCFIKEFSLVKDII